MEQSEKLEQFLTSPDNRQAAYDASRQVLRAIAPEEAPLVEVFIEPLLDMVAEGEIVPVDTADEPGGFGPPDLIVMIVVPATVSALATILTQAGVNTIMALRQKRSQGQQINVQVQNEVEFALKLAKPSLKRGEAAKMAKEIIRIVENYLEAGEQPEANRPLQGEHTPEELARLREKVTEHFSESDLQNLCFDMGIDYAQLPGQIKQDKVRALLIYCRQHNRIAELIDVCRQARPHVSW